MEIVLRTTVIYVVLLAMFRLMGKRSMSDLSAFDFVVFLIVSEAIQNALVDDDRSVVMGLTVVLTFLLLDLATSLLKRRFRRFERLAQGVPVVLVDRGRPVDEHLRRTRVTVGDVLLSARQSQGLERMDQIRYAVLETNGTISIVPETPDVEALLDRRIDAALRRRG